MSAVLAVDPAWTVHQPSGVAVVEGEGEGWHCAGVAPSYRQFVDLAEGDPVDWSEKPPGGKPDPGALLSAARRLVGGRPVDLVAVDMPLATVEVTGWREADRALSRAYGGRGCATHSPTAGRPGLVGRQMRAGFVGRGYPLATAGGDFEVPALVEVYPHPALLDLLGATYRVPYKIERSRRYWPALAPPARRRRILETWATIREALAQRIAGIDLPLPAPEQGQGWSSASLKRFEDALDALVCAWVGTALCGGRGAPFGDATAAIWVPAPADGGAGTRGGGADERAPAPGARRGGPPGAPEGHRH